METERELLEYAAKAAGIMAVWDPQHQAMNLGIVPYNFGMEFLTPPFNEDEQRQLEGASVELIQAVQDEVDFLKSLGEES